MITIHTQKGPGKVTLSEHHSAKAVLEQLQRELAQPGPVNIVVQRKPNQRKQV